MKKQILCILLILSAALVFLPGCSTAGPQKAPTAFEQKMFVIETNYLEEVRYTTNVVNVTNLVAGVPQVSTVYQIGITTNVTPVYNFTPGANAAATATTAGATTNLFAPGFGGIITSLIGGIFGLWGTLRSRRANRTAESLAQIIETGQQVLLTAPNGAQLAANWKAWMVKHQAEAGVIADASKLVANVVDTESAREAAAKITQLLSTASQPSGR